MQGDLVKLFGNPDGFDVASVPPVQDFPVIPPGDYPVKIDKSEMKMNSKKTGHFLEVAMTVLAPPEGTVGLEGTIGRKLWGRMNLDNPSQACAEIAHREAAALWRSLGIPRIKDTQEILGGMLIACVKVKDGSNEVRTYEPLPTAGVAPLAPVAAPAVQQAAPPLPPAQTNQQAWQQQQQQQQVPAAPPAPVPVAPAAAPAANHSHVAPPQPTAPPLARPWEGAPG